MIPSLLQIPSAVSDSKLHSVLPNNGKGDFQFERSTGATRINKDGLIEEVGYFSSELVQNGDFSELGSELVTNGNFATDSNWTKGTGWTISGGTANFNGGSGFSLYAGQNYVVGKTYKFSYDVLNYVSGGVRISFDGQVSQTISSNSTNNTFYHTYNGGNTNIFIQSVGASQFSIDNVSVKQVDPNDRWTLGTGWGLTTSANWDTSLTSGNTALEQNYSFEAGKNYRLKFDISNNTTGRLFIRLEGASFQSLNSTYTEYADGSYIINFNSTHNNTVIKFWGNGTYGSFSIDNISLVEVQGDRPRLSYDITNGVVEDKPHLLLEPSATNLVTFSESMNQYNPFKSTITPNSVTSPQGLVNAVNFAENSENNLHYFDSNSIAVTSGTKYTISVFAKYNGRFLTIQGSSPLGGAFATFNLENGTVEQESIGDASIEAMPNDWYRCMFTVQMNSTANALMSLLLNDSATGGRSRSYLGDGTSGVYLYGFQTEQQSYATSYIPTAGTTITRAAETCNNSKPSVNSTEGVLYAEYKPTFAAGSRQITISDETYNNRIVFECRESGTKLRANVSAGGVGQAEITIPISSLDKYYKIAIQYKVNDVSFYIDGELKGTDTSATMPTGMNVVSFSGRNDASLIMTGKTKGVAVYNEALSESQLMQLTGVTASSIYSNFVTRTASFTVEALNEVKKVIDNL